MQEVAAFTKWAASSAEKQNMAQLEYTELPPSSMSSFPQVKEHQYVTDPWTT